MCEIKSISVNTIACVPSEIDMHKFIHEKKYNEQRYGAPACAVECIINVILPWTENLVFGCGYIGLLYVKY